MFTIQTYISKNGYDTINKKQILVNEDFIPIHHLHAKQLANQQLIHTKGTTFYGTVLIAYQHQYLSSFYDWDDVDGIWLSILQAMTDCLCTGFGSSGFSERSMDWEMKKLMKKNSTILFTWHHGFASQEWNDIPSKSTVRFPEKVLLNYIIERGTEYLTFREALYDSGPIQNISKLINNLKSFK
ncbi:hypothetical protein [Peribacillus muralis]|uniref:hypothetical protein n=1 Tax=Peribacillus muralis TaxID=264697 RepID=UPI00070A6ED9|nr:hypothetical protein [Peribacillus muralis]